MAPKSLPILLTFLSILMVLPLATTALLGGYQPIKNLNDPYLVDIAKFAVNEHNKKEKTFLVFLKVIKGESQVVSGTNYNLQILTKTAMIDIKPQVCKAVVWDKPLEKSRKLVSFTNGPIH